MKKQFFSNGKIHEYLLQAIEKEGFTKPTFIQERLFPTIMKGQDAIGQSQTGTGKTLAYLLPLLQRIDVTKQELQVIIVAPTRELARQVYDEYKKITFFANKEEQISCKLIIGGTDRIREQEKLNQNQPQLIIGTPGRIKDYIEKQYLLAYTSFSLVIDEADMMLDMGFLDDVNFIAKSMPETSQVLVFSATIPEALEPFLKKYMKQPKFIKVPKKETANQNVKHLAIHLRHRDPNLVTLAIMESLQPFLALVFTNTKSKANELYELAIESGFNVTVLHGGLTPRERKRVMKEIRNLKYQYVIATDLAARGIDIKGVSHVISTQFPKDLTFYIHRSGRTGRGTYTGKCISLYNQFDDENLERLEKQGIHFEYYEFKHNQFVKGEKKRKNKHIVQKKEGMRQFRFPQKSKKVKPGYKKKYREEMKKVIKKENQKKYRGK